MFEYIDSKYTKSRYEDVGFKLKDSNKATIIWNKSTLTFEDKITALNKLAKKTLDMCLKKQIKERVNYEEMILACFKEHDDRKSIYVIKDYKDECIYGLFTKFSTALMQVEKVGNKEEIDMMIEKHEVVIGDTIPIIKNIGILNPNLFPDSEETFEEYCGMPVASMHINSKGELMSLWSDELPEEEKKVNLYDIKRFEFQFFSVPYVHHKGLPVKNVVTGEYGILETSKEEWDIFLERVKNGLYVDFSDIVHTVYCLTEKGYWSHDHWNPLEMDVEMPSASSPSDKKKWALVRAMDAMSDYMSGYIQESQVQIVLRTTKEYAEVCKELTEFEKQAIEATTVEEILF